MAQQRTQRVLYRIENTGTVHNSGMVATRPISRGQLIHQESPLVLVDTGVSGPLGQVIQRPFGEPKGEAKPCGASTRCAITPAPSRLQGSPRCRNESDDIEARLGHRRTQLL